MKLNKIHISEPHYNQSISKYVNEAFSRNEISSYGENITQFETSIQDYLQTKKEVVALNSGTSAIHLALLQLGVGKGDEVICQSFTFCASANPIVYLGANPVFVDSESDTWNMSPEYLEIAIKDRAKKGIKVKAIVFVHLFGMPAKVDQILAIANKYNIPTVEDAAEALGSSYKEKRCGTFGDFSVLSFNGNKIITASSGGALICNTLEQKKKTTYYATQARDEEQHYQHSKIGYNYRLSNICAGIGRGQMEVLENRIKSRRDINRFYQNLFKDALGVSVFTEGKMASSNYWLTCILIDDDICSFTKEDLQKAMATEGIETRPLWKPMHLQPAYKSAIYYGSNQSESLFNRGLCLPSSSSLKSEDIERISDLIKSII